MSWIGSIISRRFYGKKAWQSFFEKLFFISLKGMNIGNGGNEYSGEYQIPTLLNDKHPPGQGLVVFDVGANAGFYTKMLHSQLSKLGRNAKYYLFEPNIQLNEAISKHLKGINYELANIALGANEGHGMFYIPKSSVRASLIENTILSDVHPTITVIEVPIRTIDAFAQELGISKIDFLKIDVEGHELEVLQGAETLLRNKAIDIIQFEIGSAHITARHFLFDYFKLLGSGYSIHRMLRDGLSAPIQYEVLHEHFKTTNYLAIRQL